MKKLYTTSTMIWLIVVVTTFFYIKYYHDLKTIGEIIVSMTPAIAFFTGAILIYTRDKGRVQQAKKNGEFHQTMQLNWQQALIHDVLIYITPAVIIFIPIFFGDIPGIPTFIQAIVVFSVLSFLKIMYWKRL